MVPKAKAKAKANVKPASFAPPPAPGAAAAPPPVPVPAPVMPAVPAVAEQKQPPKPPVPAPGPGAPPKAPGGTGAGPGAAGPPPPPGPGGQSEKEKGNGKEKEKEKKKEWPDMESNVIDILLVKEGDGAIPGGQSAVEIEYTGHLASGKQFIAHREVIQLGKKMNIKGLEQAVTRIKVGSHIKLWIPSRLAYGARGAGALIPANANLTFHLQMHRIVKQ